MSRMHARHKKPQRPRTRTHRGPQDSIPPAHSVHAHRCIRTPLIGRDFEIAPGNPYLQCLTRNQLNTLFGKRGKYIVTPGPSRSPAHDPYWAYRMSALGCGVFACAWPAAEDPTKVVKITNDSSDVNAIIKANKHRVQGVPKLYSAWTLQSPRRGLFDEQPAQSYALVLERVDLHKPGIDHLDCVLREKQPLRCCAPNNLACQKIAQEVPATVARLKQLGIPVHDIHEGNVGVGQDGKWKILDLGLSTRSLDRPLANMPKVLTGPHRFPVRRRVSRSAR